jgi:hypothetical protein
MSPNATMVGLTVVAVLLLLPSLTLSVEFIVDDAGRLVLVTDVNASVYVVSPTEFAASSYGEHNRIVTQASWLFEALYLY